VPAYIYPVVYLGARRDKSRAHQLAHTVDDGPLRELMESQRSHGYSYGSTIFNTPPKNVPPVDEDGRVEPEQIAEMDLSFLRSGDLLVQATRPPTHDDVHQDRKRVQRGYTQLELLIFDLWLRYFDYCCRSRVDVTQLVADHLRSGYHDRAVMQFYQNSHCGYRSLRRRGDRRSRKNDDPRHTAAFLLRLEEAWPNGPGYLGAFGMNGTATQAWTYLLTHELPEWLERPGFTMVELTQARVPSRAFDLSWARKWKVQSVAHVPE
jgi:hypothetical protein